MNQNEWLDAIVKLYPKLHLDKRVIHHSNNNDKKKQKVLSWLEKIEQVHQKVAERNDKHLEKLYKEMYYNLYVIKEENIPESYYNHQRQIARERGYGDIKITNEIRHEMAKQVISDQKESLDKWIEYFLYDDESKSYPIWEKYWVFQGLQNLGQYNKETNKFSKRDKTTVYPFPPIEREAIFTTLNLMEQYLKDKSGPDEIRNALGSSNFKQLYEYSLQQILLKGEVKNKGTDGIWIKYDQGSDYNILRDSLQGYYTGWCTAAGENFAKNQLENGDFYVYYTKDDNNEYKVPRIAIRMAGQDKIGEIRGIASDQNMEPEMIPILDKKLEEFPDRDKYYKKERDMALLTKIDNKEKNNLDLSLEELKFLYEIDERIDGFGYWEDPRIEEIKSKRNLRKDLSQIYDCKENEVALDYNELNIETKVLKSNLTEEILQNHDTSNLLVIMGNVWLYNLTKINGLENLQTIGGDAIFRRLEYATGLKKLRTVGFDVEFASLKDAEGLENLQTIGGKANFGNLSSAKGLENLRTIGGTAVFGNLSSANGLGNLQTIGGHANFRELTSAEGLENLHTIGNEAWFNHLSSAEGLEKLRTIGGNADFSILPSANGLEKLQTIGGDANFKILKESKGLENLRTIGNIAKFTNLVSAEGLEKLQTIGGDANFGNLSSAKGLEKLQTIGGDANFRMLTSANGLGNLQTIGGKANFERLDSAEGLENLQTIGRKADFEFLKELKVLEFLIKKSIVVANFYSLKDARGLENLQTIDGNAGFNRLTSAKGLENLQTIDGNACFNHLSSAEGLENLQTIGEHAEFYNLASAVGLENLQTIGQHAEFYNLASAKGLENLRTIGGDAKFRNLSSANGLGNLQTIGGEASFSSLNDASPLTSLVNFDVNRLYCSDEIKQQLIDNKERLIKEQENKRHR